MPTISISLSDSEYSDLEAVSGQREDTSPEVTARNVLIEGVRRELESSPPSARQRAFQRGVESVRNRAVFSDAVERALKVLNQNSYPPSLRPRV
jgi:hypothetical protein